MNVNSMQQVIVAVILAVVGGCLFDVMNIKKYRAVEYYCMIVGGPIFAVFNYSQDFRYFSENRRLVHFARPVITTVLQIALECIFYKSQAIVTTTWGTGIAYLIS